MSVLEGIMDRRVLEALAAGEEPDARLHHPPAGKVMFLIFERLRKAGLIEYEPITDASHVQPVVTPLARDFLAKENGMGIAEALAKGRALFTLTRAQMRAFKALREHGVIWIEDYRRPTLDVLLDHGLAYEASDAGQLRISPKGEKATIVVGSAVLA